MSCQAEEPADNIDADATAKQSAQLAVQPFDVDHGGSMVPSSPASSVPRHEDCDDSNATIDSGYRRPIHWMPGEGTPVSSHRRSPPPSEAEGLGDLPDLDAPMAPTSTSPPQGGLAPPTPSAWLSQDLAEAEPTLVPAQPAPTTIDWAGHFRDELTPPPQGGLPSDSPLPVPSPPQGGLASTPVEPPVAKRPRKAPDTPTKSPAVSATDISNASLLDIDPGVRI